MGDYIGDPTWYYKNKDGIRRFKQYIRRKGRMVQRFVLPAGDETRDINVVLVNFSAAK